MTQTITVRIYVLVRPDGTFDVAKGSQPPHWVDEINLRGAVVSAVLADVPRPPVPPTVRGRVEN